LARGDHGKHLGVLFGDARVAVREKRAGEVWTIATVDGGC
jgi:hypothetical protein